MHKQFTTYQSYAAIRSTSECNEARTTEEPLAISITSFALARMHYKAGCEAECFINDNNARPRILLFGTPNATCSLLLKRHCN